MMGTEQPSCLQSELPALLQENHFCRKNSGGTESKPSDGSVATADEHEVFRRVSSLVAKYQEQAITEKQSRVFAQLQAMEKDRIATDAWKIITALKKDKFELERRVEKLKGHNQKLFELGTNQLELTSPRKCADVPEGLPPAKKHSLASKSTRNMTEKESKEGSGIRGILMELFRRTGSHKGTSSPEYGNKVGVESPRKTGGMPVQHRGSKPRSSNRISDEMKTTDTMYRDPCPGVAGLENLGNTCFLNAALQCLFAIQPLTRFFLSGGATNIISQHGYKSQMRNLCEVYGELLGKVWSGCYLACDTSQLYKVVNSKFRSQLPPLTQHDCHEFLALFLNELHQEFNTGKRDQNMADATGTDKADEWWSWYTDLNQSVIVDTFQGQLQNKVTCHHCKFVSVTYQAFTFLSVPIINDVQHTFVVVYMAWKPPSSGKEESRATRFKVQVSKPSTVLKLKSKFLSMLAPDERPEADKLKVAMVRDNCVLRVMDDKGLLMPFKDRDTKLYAFVPVPISPSQNQLNNSAEEKTAPENQRPSVTAFCSPITSTLAYMSTKKDTSAVVTPTGYMSAPEFAAEKSNMVDRGDLTSPNTSTPKKMRPEGRAGVTSPIYRLSYTCGECLEEVADQGEFPGGAAICKNCSDTCEASVEDNAAKISSTLHIPVIFRRIDQSSKEIKLYGHPSLVEVSEKLPARVLYQQLLVLLREAYKLRSLPSFTAYLVNYEGKHCSRCTRAQGCAGCTIHCRDLVTFQSHDHVAVELDNIDFMGLETMRRFSDDKSMSRPIRESLACKLQGCIGEFVGREKLYDPWKCPRCCTDQSAAKTTAISRYPDTLIVHLKRYSCSGGKISLPVTFPLEDLDLHEFAQASDAAEDEQGRGRHVYDLQGCVCHEGAHDRGHYTAYTRYGGTSLWYKYDDTKVTEASPGGSCSSAVYLLFYQKKTESPSRKSLTFNETSTEKGTPFDAVFAAQLEDKLRRLSTEGQENPDDHQTRSTGQDVEKCRASTATQQNSVSKEENNLSCARDSLKLNQSKAQKKKKRARRQKGTIRKSKAPEGSSNPEKPNQCTCSHCQYLRIFERKMKMAKVAAGKHRQTHVSQVPGHRRDAQADHTRPTEARQPDNHTKTAEARQPDNHTKTAEAQQPDNHTKATEAQQPDNHTKATEAQQPDNHTKATEAQPDNKSSLTSVTPASTQSSFTAIAAGVQASQPTVESAVQVTLTGRVGENAQAALSEEQPRNEVRVDPAVERMTRKLISAVENRDIRRAVCFLKRGADPCLVLDGASAFHLATGMNSSLSYSFSRLFLDFGGDPNVKTSDGLTPVHVAAMWGRTDCLKLLLGRGGDPYQEDGDGLNALDLARAFEEDTSADTSQFLSKLDEHYTTVMNTSSFSSVSLSSHSTASDELISAGCLNSYSPNESSESHPTPPFTVDSSRVGCGSWVSGLGRRMSGSLRRSSSRLMSGLRSVRSALSVRTSDSRGA